MRANSVIAYAAGVIAASSIVTILNSVLLLETTGYRSEHVAILIAGVVSFLTALALLKYARNHDDRRITDHSHVE